MVRLVASLVNVSSLDDIGKRGVSPLALSGVEGRAQGWLERQVSLGTWKRQSGSGWQPNRA